jgi:hypothetical protein
LAVSGANSTNGSVYVNNTTGEGAIIAGTTAGATITGSAGNGTTITGSTNGLALVGGTGDALNGTSTSGDGLEFTSGTSGRGAKFTGNGTAAGVEIDGGATGRGLDLDGGTDGLYVNNVRFYTGTANDTAFVIDASGSGTTVGLAIIAASATGKDIKAELDTFNFTASFFDSAQGAAAGLDSAEVYQAATAALGAGNPARFSMLHVKANRADSAAMFVYNAGSAEALKVQSDGAVSDDHAVSLVANAGNALYQYSTGNSAVEYSSPSDQPTVWERNSGTGEAHKYTSIANNSVEITSSSATSGQAALEISHTGAGRGVRLYSDSSDALLVQVATNATAAGNNAIQVEGRTYIHNRGAAAYRTEDAILVEGQRSGRALYLLSDSSTAFRISGDSGVVILTDSTASGILGGLDTVITATTSGGGADTADIKTMLENNPGIVGSDTTTMKIMGTNNPAIFYGPSGTGSGTGSFQVVIYARDTSGVDANIQGVKVTALDASLGTAAFDWTDGTGKVTFALDAGNYTILGHKTAYYFPNGSLTVSGNISATYHDGYDVVLASAGENNCNVYGYMFDAGDNPLIGATVQAVRIGNTVGVDSSDAKSKILASVPVTAPVDTSGLFQLYLRKTGEYADTTKGFYNITATYAGIEIFKIQKFYVPDAAYIDIGDTLLARGQ